MKDLHYVCFTPNLAYIPHLERCVKGLLKRVGRPDQIQTVSAGAAAGGGPVLVSRYRYRNPG